MLKAKLRKVDERPEELEETAIRRGGIMYTLKRAVAIGTLSVLPLLSTAKAQNVSVDVSSEFASQYVLTAGGIVGKGPVNQTEVDLNVGKYFTTSVWTDYDFGDKVVNETDVYLTLHSNLFAVRDPFLRGNVAGSFSFQTYTFPSRVVKLNSMYLAVGNLDYKGAVNADITFYQLLNMGKGSNIVLNLSKPFRVCKLDKNIKVYLAPTLITAYNNNFVGANGIGYYAPGVSLQLTKGPLSVELFERHQFGLNGIPSITYGGISIGANDVYPYIKTLGKVLRK